MTRDAIWLGPIRTVGPSEAKGERKKIFGPFLRAIFRIGDRSFDGVRPFLEFDGRFAVLSEQLLQLFRTEGGQYSLTHFEQSVTDQRPNDVFRMLRPERTRDSCHV